MNLGEIEVLQSSPMKEKTWLHLISTLLAYTDDVIRLSKRCL